MNCRRIVAFHQDLHCLLRQIIFKDCNTILAAAQDFQRDMCDQHKLKAALAYAQSDQRLC